jgi:transposase InsO family protein
VNVYPFIEAEQAQQRNAKRACELLKVSRAAYYAARGGQPSGRDREDASLTVLITAEHKRSKGRYGAPRIHAELRRKGHRHSRKRAARLMRQAGLAGRAPRRWKKTTIPDPAAAVRADAIRRDFTADASKINQRWCGDITYLATWEGCGRCARSRGRGDLPSGPRLPVHLCRLYRPGRRLPGHLVRRPEGPVLGQRGR